MADSVTWHVYEQKYAKIFRSMRGNVAKPLRVELGSLIIQSKYGYSDRKLIAQISENPYYQYFISLPGYQEETPYNSSTHVLLRKYVTAEMISEESEYIISTVEAEETQSKEKELQKKVTKKRKKC